jgi:hypothetical protein
MTAWSVIFLYTVSTVSGFRESGLNAADLLQPIYRRSAAHNLLSPGQSKSGNGIKAQNENFSAACISRIVFGVLKVVSMTRKLGPGFVVDVLSQLALGAPQLG